MIAIDLADRQLLDALGRLARQLEDPRDVFEEWGEYLLTSTKERFRVKEAPDGSPWAPNAPSVVRRKGRDDPLIGETGLLADRIHYRVTRNHLEVGSPMEYAATQHFGAKRGDFGTTSSGRPIPWGDIPARPFLGLSEEDEAQLLDILEDHLRAAPGGA